MNNGTDTVIKKEREPVDILKEMAIATMVSLLRLGEYAFIGCQALVLFETIKKNSIELTATSDGLNKELVISRNLRESELDSFDYVSDVSYTVYSYTILDTFLTEVTKFLLLLHPRVIGKDYEVKFHRIIDGESKNDIVNSIINERVRVISFGTVRERIKYLNKNFKMDIRLTKELYEQVDYYNELRNTLVHDTSFLNIKLDDDGKICIKQIGCPRRPQKLTKNDCRGAADFYKEIIGRVYESIRLRIFKDSPLDNLDNIIFSVFVNKSKAELPKGDVAVELLEKTQYLD